jgi:hypothetical protein
MLSMGAEWYRVCVDTCEWRVSDAVFTVSWVGGVVCRLHKGYYVC